MSLLDDWAGLSASPWSGLSVPPDRHQFLVTSYVTSGRWAPVVCLVEVGPRLGPQDAADIEEMGLLKINIVKHLFGPPPPRWTAADPNTLYKTWPNAHAALKDLCTRRWNDARETLQQIRSRVRALEQEEKEAENYHGRAHEMEAPPF